MNIQPGNLVSKTINIPAPIGGLDAFSSIAAMPQENALLLRNFVPAAYGCRVRKGYREHATVVGGGEIHTLLEWQSAIDNPATLGAEAQLFAACNKSIYNVSVAGAAPVLLLGSIGASPDTDKWQSINIDRASASYLYCVNGYDNPVVITSGTTFQRLVAGNGTTAWTINGVDPKKFVAVTQYRKYLIFVERDTSRLWYLAPGTLWGNALLLEVGGWMSRGGYIVNICVWSYNEVNQDQNRLVVLTSAGEALVFSGDDLSTATTFNIIGSYYISSPIGRRCWTKYGADILVLTQQGLVSITAIANGSMIETFPEGRSNMVQAPMVSTIQNKGTRFGWQLQYVPGNLTVIVNVGGQTLADTFQYVLCTNVNSWAVFNNMPALCWCTHYDKPYFAHTDTIYIGATGYRDRVGADGTGGSQIVADAQQAYTQLEAADLTKHMKLFRPVLISDAKVSWVGRLNFNYSFEPTVGLNYELNTDGSLWDQALWDTNALWASGNIITDGWQSAEGCGYTVSLRLSIATQTPCTWVATSFVYETGGIF